MKRPWSESRMREIRLSGLMSGEWKRSGLVATAPLLDSTTHEAVNQRNFRPPSGRSDSVASLPRCVGARPDRVGPTGRRFRTSGCEIFGLATASYTPIFDRPQTKPSGNSS